MSALRLIAPLAIGLALAACKRQADKPLPRRVLFPDTKTQAPPPSPTRMQRAETLEAVEPDDSRAQALRLPLNVVVSGQLKAKAPAVEAPSKDNQSAKSKPKKARKKKRRRRWTTIDEDWFRIDGQANAESVARIELRDAPRCAQLALFGEGKKPLRKAHWRRNVRPVLPSQRLDSLPLYVRVRCVVRSNKRDAPESGGEYRLAVTTRPAAMDEELEPNDKLGPQTQLLTHGQTMQGTLAPQGDTDLVRLNLSGAIPGEAQMLSVAGAPGVRMRVRLLSGDKPLLVRTPKRGDGVIIPNIDTRRTPGTLSLELKSLSGQAPDAPYAATVQTFIPGGCASQAACPERVPVEREPNDQRSAAMGIASGVLITGILDGPGDKDWYEVDGVPGQVVSLELQAPSGLALELQASHSSTPWTSAQGDAQGNPIHISGRKTEKRRVYVRVSGVDGDADVSALYHLRVSFADDPLYRAPGLAQQPLLPHEQGFTRRGALLSAGDKHTYLLDISDKPTQGTLQLLGDGAPGLQAVLRAQGAEAPLVTLTTQGKATAETLTGALAPGRYTVTVSASTDRASNAPYQVSLVGLSEAAPSPSAATPTNASPPGVEPSPTDEHGW